MDGLMDNIPERLAKGLNSMLMAKFLTSVRESVSLAKVIRKDLIKVEDVPEQVKDTAIIALNGILDIARQLDEYGATLSDEEREDFIRLAKGD